MSAIDLKDLDTLRNVIIKPSADWFDTDGPSELLDVIVFMYEVAPPYLQEELKGILAKYREMET